MLTSFAEILEGRGSNGTAIGALTAYNGETAIGVVRAAEEHNVPIILLISEGSLRSPNGRLLLPMVLAVADRADVPTCVQLDHVTDETLICEALEHGVGAVMADGSRLAYGENVAFVQKVVKAAARHQAYVEAELGHIEGGEDVAAATKAGALTDPGEAAEFVSATGAACLAVSIGNVHGTYAAAPDLDLSRLAAIRDTVEIPLSLHGASGLPEPDVRRAIDLGIGKININTDIRTRFFAELERSTSAASRGANLLSLDGALIDAVREVAGARLELLSGAAGRKTR